METIDFTLEIPTTLNLASTLSRKIYKEHGVVLPTNKLFGWSNEILSREEFDLVTHYKSWLEAYQRKLIVVEQETGPTLFHDILMECAKRNGRFTRESRWIDDCGDYIPNNPNKYIFAIFDTLNLAGTEGNYTTVKASMDKISKYGVRFRNKCKFTIVEVQQYNSDLATTDRARFGVQGPNLKDHMDSTGPTKDATVVLGLYSPIRYLRDDQTVWRGYDMSRLRHWLLSLHVLKNRYGQAQKYIPLKFSGAVGTFDQLKPPREMTDTDYENATKLIQI